MQFSMYNFKTGSVCQIKVFSDFTPSCLSVSAPWQQNKKTNLLIQGLRLQLNEQLTAVSFNDLDLEMFGFCIEWNLFGLAKLFIRF